MADKNRKSNGTVLVVDDVRLVCMTLRKILESGEYKVVDADDGDKAIEVLQTQAIDLVIADIKMSYIGGLELLRWIRSNASTAKLPVIMYTASKQKSDILSVAQLGVQGFLFKPIAPTELLQKVNETLGLTEEPPLETAQQTPEQRARSRGYYSPQADGKGMRLIKATQLKEEMILARDLHTFGRTLLLRKNTVINNEHIKKIRMAQGQNRPADIYILDNFDELELLHDIDLMEKMSTSGN